MYMFKLKQSQICKIISYVSQLDGSSVIDEKRCVNCNQRSPNLNGIILSRNSNLYAMNHENVYEPIL